MSLINSKILYDRETSVFDFKNLDDVILYTK